MKIRVRGISLIELILVIIVIGIAAVSMAGFVKAQQRARNVDTSVLQMTRILQAATAYHIRNHNRWPTQVGALIENDYLDSTELCSNWTSSVNDPGCADKISYQLILPENDPEANYIMVSLTLPRESSAKDLVIEMPSAWREGKTIYAYAPSPGPDKVNSSGLLIKDIAYYKTNKDGKYKTIEDFDCPKGWKKNFAGALNMIFNYKKFSYGSYKAYNNIGWVKFQRENNAGWDEDYQGGGFRIELFVVPGSSLGGLVDAFESLLDTNKVKLYKNQMALIISYCIPPDYDPYE